MNTKDKIVASAVGLFNSKGISDIAIRDIADAVGISSGNFAYHFKNKEALLEYFYQHMYDEVTIETEFSGKDGFENFNTMLIQITDFMTKYSFFYTDIAEIFRLCPFIKKDYASKYESRKEIYKKILQHFMRIELLQNSTKPELLNSMTHTIWFTMTFWQAQKKVLPNNFKEVQPYFVIKQVWQILLPYMTTKGSNQFKKIRNEK
jgi:AcrR family transcriptional regulator